MPISRYFKGHGRQVMSDMKDRYGEKKGTSVFYATANKRGQTAEGDSNPNGVQGTEAGSPARRDRRGLSARLSEAIRNGNSNNHFAR